IESDEDTYDIMRPVSWQGIAIKMVFAAMAGRTTFYLVHTPKSEPNMLHILIFKVLLKNYKIRRVLSRAIRFSYGRSLNRRRSSIGNERPITRSNRCMIRSTLFLRIMKLTGRKRNSTAWTVWDRSIVVCGCDGYRQMSVVHIERGETTEQGKPSVLHISHAAVATVRAGKEGCLDSFDDDDSSYDFVTEGVSPKSDSAPDDQIQLVADKLGRENGVVVVNGSVEVRDDEPIVENGSVVVVENENGHAGEIMGEEVVKSIVQVVKVQKKAEKM
ncbi:hypothetical protein Tco_1405175, partial [Tanacetum coccineum]